MSSPIIIPGHQQTHPTRVLLPGEPLLGQERVENVHIDAAAILEAVGRKRPDEFVSIAAGALRVAFGDQTAAAMGVPAAAEDYQSVPVRVAAIRTAAK